MAYHSPVGMSAGSSGAGHASIYTWSISWAARCHGAPTHSSWEGTEKAMHLGFELPSLFLSSPPSTPATIPPTPHRGLLFPGIMLTVAAIEGRWAGTEGPQHAGAPIQTASSV